MKFYGSYVIVSFIALVVAQVDAFSSGFHITAVGYPSGSGPPQYVACPSDFYNCGCWISGGDRGTVIGQPYSLGNFFQLNAGFCGQSVLDFIQADDGTYGIYVNNANGPSLGTCYGNSAPSGTCDGNGFTYSINDQLVCYSDICATF